MYNPANSHSSNFEANVICKVINSTMLDCVLKSIYYPCVEGTDEDMEMSSYEFSDETISNQAYALAFLDSHKEQFMLNISRSGRTLGLTDPYDVYMVYRNTIKFLFDNRVLAPTVDDWEPYRKEYGNLPIEYIEGVIGYSLMEEASDWEEFIEDAYTIESYEDIKEYMASCGYVSNVIDECINYFKENEKDWIREMNSEFPDEPVELKDYIREMFDTLFSPRRILDYSFYDNDFMIFSEIYSHNQIESLFEF